MGHNTGGSESVCQIAEACPIKIIYDNKDTVMMRLITIHRGESVLAVSLDEGLLMSYFQRGANIYYKLTMMTNVDVFTCYVLSFYSAEIFSKYSYLPQGHTTHMPASFPSSDLSSKMRKLLTKEGNMTTDKKDPNSSLASTSLPPNKFHAA